MSKLKFLVVIFLLTFSLNALTAPALAQIDPTLETQITTQTEDAARGSYELSEKNVIKTVGGIIKIALGFLGVILLILVIYGGFLWMTSQGEEEKVEKAKKIIGSAAVGVLIIVIAYALTYFILDRLIDASTPTTITPLP